MTFKYRKTQYESLYEWIQKDEGTCFYCKEDKPVEIILYDKKGICKECLNNFQIGNVGADRHVIHHIIPFSEFKSHVGTAKWFEKMGVKMILNGFSDNTYFYRGINNEENYNEFMKLLETDGIVPGKKEYMECYNSVEISKDGKNIHIIY